MAKKVKFALEMANGAQVRSNLEDLRKNFDMESVTNYFLSGKLAQWLEDRYYDEEAAKIKDLDKKSPNFQKQLCAALGVPYDGEDELDDDQRKRLEEKRDILRKMTNDEKVISRAAQTAFNQEDLADLLDMEESTIYLCGESFNIPIRMTSKKYIGVFEPPRIKINACGIEELSEKKIIFENVILDEALQPKQHQQPSSHTHAEEKPRRLDQNAIQAAQKLLQDIQNGHFDVWKESVVPFLETPFSNSKREIESELEQAARSFQRETWDVLREEVDEKKAILKELQSRYDDIFENQSIEYIPIDPDASTICDQLEFALADVRQWKPTMSLGRELVRNARYGQMESAGFSGIFGGTDCFLKNDRDLMGIAEKYYRLFEDQIEKSNAGKMMKKYLKSMYDNLNSIIEE